MKTIHTIADIGRALHHITSYNAPLVDDDFYKRMIFEPLAFVLYDVMEGHYRDREYHFRGHLFVIQEQHGQTPLIFRLQTRPQVMRDGHSEAIIFDNYEFAIDPELREIINNLVIEKPDFYYWPLLPAWLGDGHAIRWLERRVGPEVAGFQ